MAYVTEDESGTLTGLFANPQPHLDGYKEIPDDDPRIEPFRNRHLTREDK